MGGRRVPTILGKIGMLVILGRWDTAQVEANMVLTAFSVMVWEKAFPSFLIKRESQKNLPGHPLLPPVPRPYVHQDLVGDLVPCSADPEVTVGSNKLDSHGYHDHTYMG